MRIVMGPVACLHTVLALAIAALAFAGDEDLDQGGPILSMVQGIMGRRTDVGSNRFPIYSLECCETRFGSW